jgi:hypothetical protein
MRRVMLASAVALVVAAVAFTASCGGKSPANPTGTGNLSMMITDSPFTDAKAVFVTFSEVKVSTDGTDWQTINFADSATSRTCDLKKLTDGAQDVLGVGTLLAGHYTQVRLVVSGATVYFDNESTGATACAATLPVPDGASAPITIPSGVVKLNREFDVPEAGATTMLLDFKGDQSLLHETGSGVYMMRPVISVVSVQ